MKKAGQLELLDFAKHCTCYKLQRGGTEKSQLSKPSSHRAIANQLPAGLTYYLPLKSWSCRVLPVEVRLSWLHRCIDHFLPVKHQTLQENSDATDYVSPRESVCSIQMDLGIIMQCLT